jgi:hypothetical protein
MIAHFSYITPQNWEKKKKNLIGALGKKVNN